MDIQKHGLILLDIDSFGKYNNTHGHPQGDELLKQISQILKESGRYFSTINDISSQISKKYTPFIGAGTGGGTALYGAILES